MPSTPLDIAWVLSATALVLFMQAGFLCLECGLVRAKNNINVAIKNLADWLIAGLLFYLFAFELMFGDSHFGLIGSSIGPFTGEGAGPIAFFLFQLAFCGTAVTVVSGAVAERMRFGAYCAVVALAGGLIYPLFGHWAWGGVAPGSTPGWLKGLGFLDFAGSTVVHSIGGWVALAAILFTGPRIGRFGPGERPIEPSNLPVAALGIFILLLGWMGFNGGSTLGVTEGLPKVILNTLLAAIAGGLASLAASVLHKGYPEPLAILNGTLAGLVAVTASCNIVSAPSALVIGAIGGVVALAVSALLVRCRIDDAIGAVPVHLGAGLWGTLAVAMFADPALLPAGDRLTQLGIQALGCAAAAVAGLGLALPALWLIGRLVRLRVDPAAEQIGLNVSEHRASTALHDLVTDMQRQSESGDFRAAVAIEPHTEAGIIARYYNRVLERFNEVNGSLETALQDLREAELRTRRHLERINDEIRAAQEIQLGLVPASFPPPVPERPVRLAGFMMPARIVGGDFYDFFFGADHGWVVIGDVADKGMAAALFMARCKSVVRLAANVAASYGHSPDPGELMQTVNSELCQGNPNLMFVTLFLARMDLATGDIVYCNAGHPDPLKICADGAVMPLTTRACPPVGVSPSVGYQQFRTRLGPGDVLVMFTDGVTEARGPDDEQFGEDRLRALLEASAAASPSDLASCVKTRVISFTGERELADDVTLLALRREPVSGV